MYTVDLKYPEIDYVLKVKPTKNDLIGFLWEKETGVKFDPSQFKKDDKIYAKIESDWLQHTLDDFCVTRSPDFQEYLKDKYKNTAYSLYYDEQEKIAEALEQYYDNRY